MGDKFFCKNSREEIRKRTKNGNGLMHNSTRIIFAFRPSYVTANICLLPVRSIVIVIG